MIDRYNQLCWMADNDPVKMEVVDKMAVIEFFALLDKKIADSIAAQKKSEKRSNAR